MKPKAKTPLDMSYGRTLNLRCFVNKSLHSEAHAVYLEIDRVKEKQYRLISAHANIIDAWQVAVNGTAILESCNYSYSKTNNPITEAFISDLVETYGDYPSDDADTNSL